MVYQRVAHYMWLKGDTYYFNRRVPKDMQGHYYRQAKHHLD